MAIAQIEDRQSSFLSTIVIPAANLFRTVHDDLRSHNEYYIDRGLNSGPNVIVDADVVDFFFGEPSPALKFSQWHDFITQFVGNFAAGNAVNGGVAFRYRLFYERLLTLGTTITLTSTTDFLLQDKRNHILEGIALAQQVDSMRSQFNTAFNSHTSDGYGPGGDEPITDLFLSTRFRFTEAQYLNWITMTGEFLNMVNNSVVTVGNYLDVNQQIADPA